MTAERSPITFDYRGETRQETYIENFVSLKFPAYDKEDIHNLRRAIRSTEIRRERILSDIKPLITEEELKRIVKELGRDGKLYLTILDNEVSVAGFNFTA